LNQSGSTTYKIAVVLVKQQLYIIFGAEAARSEIILAGAGVV
jgi:hypothetical protein